MLDYDLFISYASEDRELVSDVVLFLSEIGLKVWYDQHHVGPGPLADQVQGPVERSRWFLLFLSRRTRKSVWVTTELSWFLAKKSPKDVIVVEIDRNAHLPPPLRQTQSFHAIDLSRSFLDGMAELAHCLVPRRDGILRFFPRRQDVSDAFWELLYRRVGREIRLMGHSLARAVGDQVHRDLVAAIGSRNVSVRLVLLTPDLVGLQQVQEVQDGLALEERLPAKIEFTVDQIRKLKAALPSASGQGRLGVRSTRRIMYSSVAIFDHVALITNYSNRGDIGNSSPTFAAAGTGSNANDDLFTTYLREFDRYWEASEHAEEARRSLSFNAATRIMACKPQVERIQDWTNDSAKPLPPPAEMVIYPTYRCYWPAGRRRPLCPDCMYKAMHSEQDLELGVLSRVIRDAIALDVRRFEFSGGGEPLQYKDIEGLLALVADVRAEHADVHFGLLTNGMYMSHKYAALIAANFSYVRFSFAEGIRGRAKEEAQFVRGARRILDRVGHSATPISVGLKLLANNTNAKRLVDDLLGIRKQLGVSFLRFDHIRIKAMRSTREGVELSAGQAMALRREFFERLFVERDRWPENVQVDLDLRYVDPNRFQCRLSPLWAILDPNAELLVCCNYSLAYQQLGIGNLREKNLPSLWGSPRHRTVLQRLSPKNVCNADPGSPCRFVEYHDVLWPAHELRVYMPKCIGGFV